MIDATPRVGVASVPLSPHPLEYRLDEMVNLVKTSFCTMDYRVVSGRAEPMTCLKGIGLGAVDVFRHDGVGKRFGSRGSRHIRNHWVDDFVIPMPLDARVTTRQDGHLAKVEPGSFVFLSTSRPFDASVVGLNHDDASSLFIVRISGSLLRQRAPLLDKYCGMPLAIEAGASTIMRSMFDLALSEGSALSRAQLDRFNDMVLDAIINVAAEMSGTPPQRKTAQERLREETMSYIQRNLSDPALCDRLIADHCNVSVRYLQAAFAAASTTVGAFVREARLQQCRASLLNPGLRDRTILDIALGWGFNDAPYFSRAYKARFGLSPSADRHANGQVTGIS